MSTTVGDLMRRDVDTLRPSQSLLDCARMMRERGGFVVPVTTEEGELVGMVSPRAIVEAVARGDDLTATTVGHVAEPSTALRREQPVEEAVKAFAGHAGSELPVTEEGKVIGVLRRRALRSYGAAVTTLGAEPAALVQDIDPQDEMLEASAGDYYLVGADALARIREALALTGATTVSSVLDLGCGHGRVMRMLRAAFPSAKLTACDIDREAVDFCAASFDATPVYAGEDPGELRFGERFDLIWSGSLLTHLDSGRWEQVVSLFESALAPGGVVVFTTHGRRSAEMIRAGTTYNLGPDALARLLEGYEREGFGYSNYPHSDGYGISLARPSWVVSLLERRPELRLLMLKEAGWSNHQDVVACTRVHGGFP
jgi:CBS domain-containing protein/SAM-dependent methyltransferase